ncbi:TetR/AcrR family transcriptional regulator [Pectobacterium aroidearum]|uniref:TetR/AcrR family transcriptional regulator n=1 Tax=Pectobacterium aroidearum TaxID=1201031 RepID=UPI0031584045
MVESIKGIGPRVVDNKSLVVLQAATEIFLVHGFSSATTDMIQKAAGVSKATLYACFPSKDSLFSAVIEHECFRLEQSIRAIQTAPGDFINTLYQIGLSYLGIVLSPNGLALYRVVVAEAPRSPHLARQFYLSGPKTTIALVAHQLELAEQAEEISIHSIGTEVAAAQFINLLRGEALMECLMHPESRPSAEQLDRWVHTAITTFIGVYSRNRKCIDKVSLIGKEMPHHE